MARAPFQVLVIPYRPTGDMRFEYALLRRSDAGFWQPVVGGGEDDETPLQAAQREAFEEAGIDPASEYMPLSTIESVPVTEFAESYLWGDDVYVVPQCCFGVHAGDRQLVLSHEHTEHAWLTFHAALERLEWDGEKTALWELDRRLRGLGPRD
jgi:dATP pyrophosphohydrolase